MTPRATLTLGAVCALLIGCASGTGLDDDGPASLDITLEDGPGPFPAGEQARATLWAFDSDGSAVPVPSGAEWMSSDTTVATVNSSGLVTMLTNGTTMIAAEAGGLTATITVTVAGTVHRRNVTQSETWSAAGSPHYIEGPIRVGARDTVTVTIEPGATVRFRDGATLDFGIDDPGRLVIPPGSAEVVIEGAEATPAYWEWLTLSGPYRSELRNVTFRHCGKPNNNGSQLGCLHVRRAQFQIGPDLLIQNLTVEGAFGRGLTIGAARIDPASHGLVVENTSGPALSIGPDLTDQLPSGIRLENNELDEIHIQLGRLERDVTLDETGYPWRLTNHLDVDGSGNPVLTVPAGTIVNMARLGRLTVDEGGLVVGEPGGAEVVIGGGGESWGGIEIRDHAVAASFWNTTIRGCSRGIACLQVTDGLVVGKEVFVENLTIEDAGETGLWLTSSARFAPGSNNLTITGGQGIPLELRSGAVPTIPDGQYTGNAKDAIRVEGDVEADATWSNLGVPYALPDGLTVGVSFAEAVLTLEPGVTVRVAPGRSILVGQHPGALVAVGTPEAPIVFTVDGDPSADVWEAIWLRDDLDARTRFEHVEVLHSGQGEPGLGGAFRIRVDVGGLFENATIRHSATCGLLLLGTGDWADDYEDPALGNTFEDNAGPALCRLPA